MAGTEEDWDGAPYVIESGAFGGQDGKTVPVSFGGLGGPVIGEATIRADSAGAVADMRLRHAKTGTACPGPYCEECATEWLLTGNLYYTREAPPGLASCWECSTPFGDGEGYGDMFCSQGCADTFRAGLGA